MTVTWWTASGIILYHRSIAYELSICCSPLIYFSVAIAIITTKYQKHYFCYHYLLLPLPLLSYYFATKYFATDIKFPSVVELTTQLLILENVLWLPLCRINKFGLNTLPSQAVAIPYTCGLSRTFFWRRCRGAELYSLSHLGFISADHYEELERSKNQDLSLNYEGR